MSGYGQAIATISSAKRLGVNSPRKIRKAKKVKLTLKQRIRNWLNSDDHDEDVPQTIASSEGLTSEGMRLQIYKANGGYVVETRSYDSHKDRHFNTMHVITEDSDLGDSLGKIVMMEALKR